MRKVLITSKLSSFFPQTLFICTFYLRKVRISAKIFHGIDKMTIFAEEKCGYPQKSFVDYGYREKGKNQVHVCIKYMFPLAAHS